MVEYTGWKPALTAALSKVGETIAVEQITLTAPMAYTLPAGTPSGVVHSVVFTQNNVGGHTVTYGGNPVTVDLTAGASTLVEIWPGGKLAYPGAVGSGGVTDHGALTGLGDDDHPQYHTDARGDARYSALWHGHTLDAVTDTATRVAMTPAERTKLSGVANGATANATDAQLRSRNTHTGTQTAASISDLTEVVQDIVGALIVAGTNTTVSYDDAAGTFTINASTAGGGSTDPEIVRDVIGGALVAGSGIQITVNDAGDTITIASTAVLPTRRVIAGAGLTGGGDLSADRTLSIDFAASGVNSATKAVRADDSRLTDARTPTTHNHDDRYYTETETDTLLGGKAPVTGQAAVNALTAGASVTVPATHSMHTLTMTSNTTLTFANPTAGHAFTLKLSGAFTPTFPASVTWAGGSAPTYTSGKVYVFATFDVGTSWIGSSL